MPARLNPKRVFLLSVLLMLVVMFGVGLEQLPQLMRVELPNPDSFYKLVLLREYSPETGFQYMARDNAPFGTYQHWSAVHSWTVLQFHQILQAAGLERDPALVWSGAMITMMSMLALAVLVAKVVIDQGSLLAAIVAVIVLVTSGPLRGYGQPVQITHHIFMLVPLVAAASILLPCEKLRRRWTVKAWCSGALLALSLWISPETMPLVLVLLATRVAYRLQYPATEPLWPVPAGLFGVLLFAWWRDPPPPTFSAWALDHVSLAWLAFGLLLSVLLILADVVANLRWPLGRSIVAMTAAGIVAALIWLFTVPGAMRGPEGLIPAELKSLWWDHIHELKPVTSAWGLVAALSMPLVAAILLLMMAFRHRALWMLVLALSMFAYGVLAARHTRMGAAAGLLATLCYGIVLSRLAAFREPRQANTRPLEQLMALLLIVLPSVQLITAYLLLKSDAKEQIQAEAESPCKLSDIADTLNFLPAGTVLAPINEGPELLWRTHHRIIAGNYHHNVQGLLDHFYLWRSVAPDESAKRLVDARKVDYILSCDFVPDELKLNNGQLTLASRLAAGESLDWLPEARKTGHWRLYVLNR